MNDTIQTTPVINDTIQTTPVMNDTIKITPVMNDIIQTTPVMNDTIQTTPVVNETMQFSIMINNTIQTTPVINDTIQTTPVMNDTIQTTPLMNDTIQSSLMMNDTIQTTPVMNDTIQTTTVLNDTIHSTPVVNETMQSSIMINDTIQTTPVMNDTMQSSLMMNDTIQTTQVMNDTIQTTSVVNETIQSSIMINDTRQTTPVTTDTIHTTPVMKDTIQTTPVMNDTIHTTPVMNDTIQTTSVVNETIQSSIMMNDTIQTTPVMTDTIQTTPVLNDTIQTTPVMNDTIQTTSVVNETIQSSIMMNDTRQTTPVTTDTIHTTPVMKDTIQTTPVMNDSIQTPPVMNDTIQTSSVVNETMQSSIMINDTIQTTPVMTDTIQTTPVMNDTIQTTPVMNDSIQTTQAMNDIIQTTPVMNNTIQTTLVMKGTIQTTSVMDYTIQTTPVMNDTLQTSQVMNNTIQTTPVMNDTIQTTPGVNETTQSLIMMNDTIQTTPVRNDPIPTTPVMNDTIQSSPMMNDTIQTTPVMSDTIQTTPVMSDTIQTTPAMSDTIQTTPVMNDTIHTLTMINDTMQTTPVMFTGSVTISHIDALSLASIGKVSSMTSVDETGSLSAIVSSSPLSETESTLEVELASSIAEFSSSEISLTMPEVINSSLPEAGSSTLEVETPLPSEVESPTSFIGITSSAVAFNLSAQSIASISGVGSITSVVVTSSQNVISSAPVTNTEITKVLTSTLKMDTTSLLNVSSSIFVMESSIASVKEISSSPDVVSSTTNSYSSVSPSTFMTQPTVSGVVVSSTTNSYSSVLPSTSMTQPTSSVMVVSSTTNSYSSVLPSTSMTQPTSSVVAPDNRLAVTLNVKESVDIKSQEFKDKIEKGLEESFIAASGSRRKRSIRDKRQANQGVDVKVTDTQRTSGSAVDVQFEVYKDGGIVPATEAENTYKTLSDVELSATIGYPVAQPIVALSSAKTPDNGVNWSDFNGPLIIILIVVPSALVIIVTIGFIYVHCYVRSYSVDGIPDRRRLDLESGESLSGSTSVSSTFKRRTGSFNEGDTNPSEKENASFIDAFDIHETKVQPIPRPQLYQPPTRRQSLYSDSYDVNAQLPLTQQERQSSFGNRQTKSFELPDTFVSQAHYEREDEASNRKDVDKMKKNEQGRRYKANEKAKKKSKPFARRDSDFPVSGFQYTPIEDQQLDSDYVHGDSLNAISKETQNYDLENERRFDGYIPYHTPSFKNETPQTNQKQNNLNREEAYRVRPTAPQYEPCPPDFNIQEYLGDKNHPGKLVFSSDYIFANEIANPVFNPRETTLRFVEDEQHLPMSSDHFIPNERLNTDDAVYYTQNYHTSVGRDPRHVNQRQPSANNRMRLEGVIEDVSSTEDFIYITDPYYHPYHHIEDHNSTMEPPILMTAGHVEQLAKMSRLPKPSPDQQTRFFPAVKLRNVTYHPPEPTKDTTTKQRPEISSDTNTDIDTPRLPTRADSNKQLFQKTSILDNEDGASVDNKSEIERLRNKLRQREREHQKHLGHEYFDPTKENRKRRIYTKRERDRMRRTGNQSYDSHDEVMSEMDFRQMRGYNSGRSGCSTPGGSVDEMKLGRNMRAAPRRIDSKDGVRMSQRNTTNKDLIEILNRRQQLLQQQREDRRRYLQDQEAKEKAREIVNLAYLNADSTRKRKEGEKLLDDAFSLAKNSQKFNDGYKMESREHSDARDGGSSPRGFTSQQSPADQLWSDGHIQEEKHNSVTSENKKDDDFFDESPKQGPSMGSEDHMVKYVRDELQRLET
ncbi:uncharacterized protein [Mytilus edulis]|uniref:uncharacterized protein isoform X4 n=1 Tax=Mytilus edulis TaxID=6550 RepID=UPI0039EF5728